MHVQGGTGAGTRPPFEGRADDTWECDCPGEVVADGLTMAHENPGWLVNCPWCWCRRPGS